LATSDPARRIRLPSDLSGSLKYLDDLEIQRLRDAVAAEIARRARVLGKKEPNRASNSAEAMERVPEGKANLIRASFKAGLTPPAIARTVGMPLPLVRRVLKSKDL
jgi:hypothetical protein